MAIGARSGETGGARTGEIGHHSMAESVVAGKCLPKHTDAVYPV